MALQRKADVANVDMPRNLFLADSEANGTYSQTASGSIFSVAYATNHIKIHNVTVGLKVYIYRF